MNQRRFIKIRFFSHSRGRKFGIWFTSRMILLLIVAQAGASRVRSGELPYSVTYSKEIAPILFQECAVCHRPGQVAPFELLTYGSAKRHARDMVRAVTLRLMPPWLPAQGYGEFRGERHLTDRQISLLRQWVEQGCPEGDPADLPTPPKFPVEWQLGKPDLIVEPSEPLLLSPSGKDPYFNFVLPIHLPESRYVAGVELIAGTPALHHAFLFIDETTASRRRGEKFRPMGFEGMHPPQSAAMPAGQLLGWNPGKTARLIDGGLFWKLPARADLVLQAHLNPQGKTEQVRPRIGFFFTNQPPVAQPYRMWLTTFKLDIAPGDSNYVAETAYTLPVDLTFLRVGAHAHFLCKHMEGFAILPNGEKKWLLLINDWNFYWQGDYEYKTPVEIPKGSKVVMRFTYDNSTNNPSNPFTPPRRTVWGPETTDEMGELTFQCLPRNPADYNKLFDDFQRFNTKANADYYKFRLKGNPADTDALLKLGRALTVLDQTTEALTFLREAIRLEPTNDLPHFTVGLIYIRQGRLARALGEFKQVVRLNASDSEAYEKIGIICKALNRPNEARQAFENALRIDPDSERVRSYLEGLK